MTLFETLKAGDTGSCGSLGTFFAITREPLLTSSPYNLVVAEHYLSIYPFPSDTPHIGVCALSRKSLPNP